MSRRAVAVVMVIAVVVSSAVGWLAGSQILSPAEAAARTAPPEPSPILVAAEDRVLSADVVTRGTARFGSPQELIVAPSALKASLGIVGRVPLQGDELVEGDIVATASGRPVFLMIGEQPVFRDMGPGIEGEDVRQLQEGLKRLGFFTGVVDGIYAETTEQAVAAWYEDAGYKPFSATDLQLAAIRDIEKELIQVRLDILSSRETIANAEEALGVAAASNTLAAATMEAGTAFEAAARAEAVAANQTAAADLATQQAVLDIMLGFTPPTSANQAAITLAQAELAAAQTLAASVRASGQSAVGAAQAAVDQAQDALTALEADPASTPAQLAVAQAAVDGAQTSLNTAQTEANAANGTATADVAIKQAAVNFAMGAPPTEAELNAARTGLATAQAHVESIRLAGEQAIINAQLGNTAASTSSAAAQAAIRGAQASISIARQAISERHRLIDLISVDLALVQRQAGIQVPADELIFVTQSPVKVAELALNRGAQLTGVLMNATDATVLVDGTLNLEVASLVQDGMQVFIDEPDLGIKAVGTVHRVAEIPGTNGVDGFHVYFQTLVDSPPATLVGASVRLTLPVESTETNVLAVPLNAVFLGADGSSEIQRMSDGVLQVVKVEPGLAADGFVEVRPLVKGMLNAGDLVLIGYDQPAPAAGG